MTDQMRTQWLFIQAQDVWMFRDSKPFAAAQSFVARSIFPPTPQTMQGAIRTAYLEQRGGRWSEYANGRIDTETSAAIGLPARKDTAASFGTLELDGPYIARKKEDGAITRLVQMPLDVLYNKDKHQYVSLMPDQDPGFVSNAVEGWTPLVSTPQAGDCEEATGWLDDDEFAHYLKGNVPQTVVKQAEIYGYDERVGLALDYSKRVNQPSMFYHAHFIRPAEDIGLLVGLKNATLAKEGLLTLGGESRCATYETVEYQAPAEVAKGQRLKIVLLTPAYFANGWWPANFDWSRWVGPAAQWVSVALGKPLPISGWDIVRREPKALYHYVPAGSVFYFENASIPTVPFTETPDAALPAAQMGFGRIAVGTWNYLNS